MHKIYAAFSFCIIIGLFSQATFAQTPPLPKVEPTAPIPPWDPDSPESNESWGRNLWIDFISPVTTHAWIPFVAGSGATLAAWGLRRQFGEPLQSNWIQHRPVGSSDWIGNTLGQLIPNAVYFIGMYADYWWGSQSKKSRERAILMFRASAYAGLMTDALKYVVQERRPNNSNNYSFPSGHAATTFAFAAIIGAEHEWYWSLPAYLLATYVGATRIADNAHRLHDVIAGTTIGISYGLGVYYHWHDKDPTERTTYFQLLPTDDISGAVLTVTHVF